MYYATYIHTHHIMYHSVIYVLSHCVCTVTYVVLQGSPTPGPRTSSGPWPVRNRAAQQEVSSGQVSEVSSAAPYRSLYAWTIPSTPPQSVKKLSSMKPVPGAKMAGDRCFIVLALPSKPSCVFPKVRDFICVPTLVPGTWYRINMHELMNKVSWQVTKKVSGRTRIKLSF